MYIRIIKSGRSTYWYSDHIDEVFWAKHTFHSGETNWEVIRPNGDVGYVDAVDCIAEYSNIKYHYTTIDNNEINKFSCFNMCILLFLLVFLICLFIK